jgi:hypothetical protein
MNRLKRFALNVVVLMGMVVAMSSLGLAQQETIPDQFLGADEIKSAQPLAQGKHNEHKKVTNSHRQSNAHKRRQLAKQNASGNQTVAMVRK